jgi:glutamine amidotransferase-like uncharacterized protein
MSRSERPKKEIRMSKHNRFAAGVALLFQFLLAFGAFDLFADVTVGVYSRASQARYCYREIATAFLLDPEIHVIKVSASDIAGGILDRLQVLVLTDIYGQDERTTPIDLGDLGKQKVRDFVESGGVYIGLGSGASIGVEPLPRGLGLVDVQMVDPGGEKRGLVRVRLGPTFTSSFPELKEHPHIVAYIEGGASFFKSSSTSCSLFCFESEAYPEILPASALIKSSLGKGTVFLSGWKMYKMPGLKWILPRLAHLGTDGKIADYRRYINLSIQTQEDLYTEASLSATESLMAILNVDMAANTESDVKAVVDAMTRLDRGSCPDFLPIIPGRLRNHHKEIRKKAGEIINKWQYFAASRDLWTAIRLEGDASVLKTLIDAYDMVRMRDLKEPQAPPQDNSKIKVAIYDDYGIEDPEMGVAIQGILKLDPMITSFIVDAADIAGGTLKNAEAVIFPGGSGGGTASMLGTIGIQNLREFVRTGGAYLGFCAGAYLGTSHYKWSLHLLNTGSFNSEYWARGGAIAKVRIEPLGRKIFPELKDELSIYQLFWQGPLIVEGCDKTLPGFEIPFTFVSDVYHRAPASKGSTPGKPWMVISPEDSPVRVVLSSGHPELTPGARYFVPRLVRWLVRRDIVSYDDYMNPRKYRAEYMFDKAWAAGREAAISILRNSDNPDEVEVAMKQIAGEIFEAHWYIPGFLRSWHARLRRLAADLIVDGQMFWTRKDLETALERETDGSVKSALAKALAYVRMN